MDEEFYADEIDYLQEYNVLKNRTKPKARQKLKTTSKKPPLTAVKEVAEVRGLEGGFKTTYKPARYEEVWLLDSIRGFYDQNLISDVLAQLKGGKEASVYRCKAEPTTGHDLVVAKVYRPRQFRNLSNDKLYRTGRPILTAEGQAVHRTDHRIIRAINKKTAYGEEVRHTSWLMYEYVTLERLHRLGAAVPQPLGFTENAILMTYYGDENKAAPTLNEISLGHKQAQKLFQKVLANIELMWQNNLIHGDLSAYNILFWQGDIVFIDFPQVVSGKSNPHARFILQRDITRVCDYFGRQGVDCDPEQILGEFWQEEPPGTMNDEPNPHRP
jgi:RIO kinase 1